MKTAIYIEDGRTQFVLTPETKIDKEVLDEIQSTNLKTYRGEFYGCQGGWTRHATSFGSAYDNASERSLIFVIDNKVGNCVPREPPTSQGTPDCCHPSGFVPLDNRMEVCARCLLRRVRT